MVRTVVATSPSALFGTLVRRFLMKCVLQPSRGCGDTPQGCQAAAAEERRDRLTQALVGVGGHQLDAGHATRHEPAEKRQPEGPGLGGAGVDAQHLTLPICVDRGGDDDAHRRPPSCSSDLHEGGAVVFYVHLSETTSGDSTAAVV
jgi:hypothetical protein